MDFAAHCERVALSTARLAATAPTREEANHYWAENARFEELAVLAAHDPQAARRAYRPRRAYEPQES